MSERLALRPRRSHPKRRVALVTNPPTGIAALTTGAAPPSLVFGDDDHRRDDLISSGLSAAIHAALFLLLITVALLTPKEVVERIIPLELRARPAELPGTNAEPAPAGPKAVGAARPSAAALAAAAAPALSAAEAQALRDAAMEAARAALEAMDTPQPVAAPTQIERNAIQADTLAARAASEASTPVDVVNSDDIAPLDIDPADLAALDLGELAGPRDVDTSALDTMTAGEAFAALNQLDGRDYADAATLGEVSSGATTSGGIGGNGVDTGISAEWSGAGGSGIGAGGGAGGEGTAIGSVRCLESAFVQRYLARVKQRTNQHWVVPDGVPPDAQVKLRFDLDDAGMASNIETLDAADPLLGRSAEAALRNAAPFPPMSDDDRCLAAGRIKLTFTVPQD